MNRRIKSSLLAVLALFALPALSACIFLPPGDDGNGTETVETDQNGTDDDNGNDNGDDGDNGDDNGDNGIDSEEARFSGSDDFFSQVGDNMRSCFDTSETPIPEEVEELEPLLTGSVYASCTFADGEQLLAVLMPDPNDNMADTALGISSEIDAFKESAGVETLAIGGNWLLTSYTDSLVTDFTEIFGGTVY